MGNICPWCLKNSSNSHTNNYLHEQSFNTDSQNSLVTSSNATDRTPLLGKSKNYHTTVTTSPIASSPIESSSFGAMPAPLPPPPPLHDTYFESKQAKISANENEEPSVSILVERMLPDLIDVCGWGVTSHLTNSQKPKSNAQIDNMKQILTKSLQTSHCSSLPDVGIASVAALLSSRPVSSDICHFVAHTTNELSRLLVDEIKITHKEDLVIKFE